jgi:hypothetical protein
MALAAMESGYPRKLQGSAGRKPRRIGWLCTFVLPPDAPGLSHLARPYFKILSTVANQDPRNPNISLQGQCSDVAQTQRMGMQNEFA